jgi:GxxExxY protein
MKTKEELEVIAKDIVDAILTVHRHLGPGLLESAYQACLAYELTTRGHQVESGKKLPIRYKDVLIESGFNLDLRVDGEILIENKAVQSLIPIHEAQLLTYMKLTGGRLGFLVNWNVILIKDGIKRMVNKL